MATREQTLEYLRFFAEFDTPEGDDASRTVSRLRDRTSADRAPSRRIPAAAELIASGRMDSGMFFDGWYDTDNACRVVAPWLAVMRAESNNPALYAEVEALGPAYAAFRANPGVRAGAPLTGAPTALDREIFDAYDQAGGLMRRGLLHPALFFDSWRSPSGFWDRVGPWIFALRERSKNPHGYDQIDWLVDFERERAT